MNLTTRIFCLAAFAVGAVVAPAQKDEAKSEGKGPKVEIPNFGNEMCPYMPKKKAKVGQFVETKKGRVFVCCKDCVADAKADGEAAYAKAYPKTKTLENKTCPIMGEAIDKDSASMTWQGYSFKLCCEGCIEGFKKNPDAALALMTNAKLKDVANKTCPVSGEAADGGCVIVGDELVRLRSRKDADDFKKDAAAYLEKAKGPKKDKPVDGDDHDKGKGNDKDSKGEDGKRGEPGKKGEDGKRGEDGKKGKKKGDG